MITIQGYEILPILTTLIGLGGFTVGIYSFLDPLQAAQIYGVPAPALQQAEIEQKQQNDTKKKSSDLPAAEQATSSVLRWNKSYIHALGSRNFTAGVMILSLTAQWQMVSSEKGPMSTDTFVAKKSLGVVVLTGSLVPIVDTWVCITSCGDSSPDEVVKLSRRASLLHAGRSLVWIVGGVWCCFG